MKDEKEIKETISQLQKIIDAGESIKIKYDGGSQAGEVREIKPIKIDYEHNYLDAICATINKEKTFNINKITIAPKKCKNNLPKRF